MIFSEKNEFIAIPIIEKTIENPRTKNNEFKKTFVLFIEIIEFFRLTSDNVVPEIYAKNAGTIGNIQGAKNDPIPARNEMIIETSCILFQEFDLIKY